MTYDQLSPFQRHVMTLAGEFAEMFAFNRSLGQLFGFLYISNEPVSLEELASACHMSKGNASLHLRTLETWGAVRRSYKPGTRKDFYSAAEDLRQIATRRLQEGVSKRIQYARERLKVIQQDPAYAKEKNGETNKHWNERVREIESLMDEVEKGINFLPKLFQLKNLFK